ncbi:hypothetical protein [Papillibacter cinnamivorans]|uniref:Uncharacterized protein n=1 Tax=Papillibacter cinnamivorans DSM 12816 TaxID=1122930 RepID=A0A1W2CA85_9FIRM|nr:hypothetical protein [Papillibacter cinnamivorans]SMC82006.1 hypothetical protein SAMN02745168_2691 [Papillibacter cinnamivorans DSM 12816]
MKKRPRDPAFALYDKYPPSPSCSCDICREYCLRPGWWTVSEARRAMVLGYGGRMMLEFSPDFSLGVLAPAFRGCEGFFALKEHSHSGCTFLSDGLCRLHGTGLQPLECRFCHHERIGLGIQCHSDLENNWNTPDGRNLVSLWLKRMGLTYLSPLRNQGASAAKL